MTIDGRAYEYNVPNNTPAGEPHAARRSPPGSRASSTARPRPARSTRRPRSTGKLTIEDLTDEGAVHARGQPRRRRRARDLRHRQGDRRARQHLGAGHPARVPVPRRDLSVPARPAGHPGPARLRGAPVHARSTDKNGQQVQLPHRATASIRARRRSATSSWSARSPRPAPTRSRSGRSSRGPPRPATMGIAEHDPRRGRVRERRAAGHELRAADLAAAPAHQPGPDHARGRDDHDRRGHRPRPDAHDQGLQPGDARVHASTARGTSDAGRRPAASRSPSRATSPTAPTATAWSSPSRPTQDVVLEVAPSRTRTYDSRQAFNPATNGGENNEVQVRTATRRAHIVLGGTPARARSGRSSCRAWTDARRTSSTSRPRSPGQVHGASRATRRRRSRPKLVTAHQQRRRAATRRGSTRSAAASSSSTRRAFFADVRISHRHRGTARRSSSSATEHDDQARRLRDAGRGVAG